jgi:NADH-quinone oxidoreductase subunit L
MEHGWLWLIAAAPLAGFAVNALIALATAPPGRSAPRGLVAAVACLAPAVSFAVAVQVFLQLRGLPEDGRRLTQTLYTWIASGSLRIDVAFAADTLSSLMLLFVTGVGTLIHVYSVGYMRDDRGFVRYFTYLNLFMFAMLVLVLADNLPLLFVGWEGVGLCSYLLIGYWYEDPAKAAAGKKAFVVNRIGDFGVLLAMFLIFWTLQRAGAPSLAFADVRAHLDDFAPAAATAVCLLLFLGATGKSAQIPLYVWLPDAMAGPTPVSALIHAATMVTAGVYLVARLGFLFAAAPLAGSIVALVGGLTAVVAATIGVAQNDFKKVLAYSTVSQLGYMFVGVGVGAYAAGIFHVFTHAFFKACLFLGSGAVIHALHDEQDIRQMGGLRRVMPITFWTFVVATLALAGVPPLAGFFSKDAILWEALSRPNPVWPWLPRLLWVLLVAGAFLTAFYMWRLVSLVFLGSFRGPHDKLHHAHEAPFSMAMPLVVLATGSVLAGLVGVPSFLGGSNRVEGWLHPAVTGASWGPAQAAPDAGGDAGEPGAAHQDARSPDAAHDAAGTHAGTEPAHAAHSAAAEWAATAAAFAAGLAGLGLGHLLYARRPELSTALAQRFAGVRSLLAHKYWVDEIYDATVVRPLHRLSDAVLWRAVDVRLIDGLVNLLAGFTKAFSYVFRFAQSGYVQTYALVLVLGVLVLLLHSL